MKLELEEILAPGVWRYDPNEHDLVVDSPEGLSADPTLCQSPIESLMLDAFKGIGGFTILSEYDRRRPSTPFPFNALYGQHGIETCAGHLHVDFAVERYVPLPGAIVRTHYPAGHEPDDWQANPLPARWIRVAIELDGHDFHQRTKEQVTRDYRRTRAIVQAGWTVLRYTGSEVWIDAASCAREIAKVVRLAVARIELIDEAWV